jgi:hypothetical protein
MELLLKEILEEKKSFEPILELERFLAFLVIYLNAKAHK